MRTVTAIVAISCASIEPQSVDAGDGVMANPLFDAAQTAGAVCEQEGERCAARGQCALRRHGALDCARCGSAGDPCCYFDPSCDRGLSCNVEYDCSLVGCWRIEQCRQGATP